MRDTRETFQIWNGRPWAVLRGWIALSLAVALALLAAVWVVAGLLTPDVTPIHLPGVTEPTSLADVAPILWRNSLVLALHVDRIDFATLPFANVARLLQRVPLPVPRILGHSDDLGILALEDLAGLAPFGVTARS